MSEVTGLISEHQKALIGRRYRVGVCFVFHLNAEQKIDVVREYLDFGFLDLKPTRGIVQE